MKAMILAAGRGERLRPLTDSRPKPLLEVQGKPLIVHHLESLAESQVREVVINVSWLGEQIKDMLGDGREFGLRIEYSEESEALETAGGIIQALDKLGDRFIVVNADIFTDFDFSSLFAKSDSGWSDGAHLVLIKNPEHNAKGDFNLQNSRPGRGKQRPYTFSGISMLSREFFAGLGPGRRSLGKLLFDAADRNELSAELFQGMWVDVGTLERLQSLQHR